MIGDLLLAIVLVVLVIAAAFGGFIFALWAALRAPALGFTVAGVVVLTIVGFWLRSIGV